VTTGASFLNPVITGLNGDDHGDPFVIKFLDSFYLYHTGETSGRRGVSVHRSPDLVHWEFAGYALEAAETGWAWADLWAPEVVYERGTFYMYISARPERGSTSRGPWQFGDGEDNRRIGLARSSSPLGPFVADETPLVDHWAIDAHPFRDDDGSMWLFYNVQTADFGGSDGFPGTGTVCDRLVEPDRLAGQPTPVSFPSHDWEGVPTRDWFWNEAPYVLKRRGRYFQMYSGGCFVDSSYAVGLTQAGSLRGPWRKDPRNPILSGGGRIRGPGHHSVVYGPDVATRYVVYHGYVEGEQGRKVHLDRVHWAGDRPLIAGPTEGLQPPPPGPVFDPAVPHHRAEAWARGSWVEVAGRRFPLAPTDVWHQVESVQGSGQLSVRVGGVLRSSMPAGPPGGTPSFASDGDVIHETATSCLEDALFHGLPASSSYVWRWGGRGPLELTLAVKGSVRIELGDRTYEFESDDGYGFAHVSCEHGVDEIAVHPNGRGATVADLSVYARS
jgi:GH43 family beta-xylosidase